MYSKDSVSKLFESHKGVNFIISTNIAEGRGINGVSYASFYGRQEWSPNTGYASTNNYNNSEVVAYEDDFIVLRNRVKDAPYNSGVFLRYIPYEAINCITFMEECSKWGARL